MNYIKHSPEWKYKIDIKRHFEEEVTPESTEKTCNILISELNKTKVSVEGSNIIKDHKQCIHDGLEEIIDHFDFCKQLANGTIEEKDWDDYSFDGDFETMFNDYLEELYDLADMRVIGTNNISKKFLWVG